MPRKHKKDKNRKLKFPDTNVSESNLPPEDRGIGKRILILTEGETEYDYFNGIKNNIHLKNQLSGIEIQKSDSMITMLWTAMSAMSNENNYKQIWLVYDNDKRNAFILKEDNLPIPELQDHFNEDEHSYFLSRYDYLQWLKSVLGADAAIEMWGFIQYNTQKHNDFEKYESRNPYALFLESELFRNKRSRQYTKINTTKVREFDHEWKNYTQLAYTCIAFEFWLLLHFEKNKIPFLWVDKDKDERIDVVTYFRTHWRPDYEKGDNEKEKGENKCTAYTCLLDDYNKKLPTLEEQRKVILRIIEAYLNTQWLKKEMQPILERQNCKWYEVNPYVKGLDKLILELLNIKHLDEEIEYFTWFLNFQFQYPTLSLSIKSDDFVYNSSEIINNHHKKSFEIVSGDNKSHFPIGDIPTTTIAGGETKKISIKYDIPETEQGNLTLFFNDPRRKSPSPPLIIPLIGVFSNEEATG